jgi:hypothetical protein
LNVAVTLFTVGLIASLAPAFSSSDLGIFKIPILDTRLQGRLRIWGPIVLVVTLAGFLPVWPKPSHLEPKQTRWGPLDGEQAGIFVVQGQDATKLFIPWSVLKPEIEKKLFPQVVQLPGDCSAQVAKFRGRTTGL